MSCDEMEHAHVISIPSQKLRAIVLRQISISQSQRFFPLPSPLLNNTIHGTFVSLLNSLAVKLQAEYPSIMYVPGTDGPLLKRMAVLVKRIRQLINPSLLPAYQTWFAQLPAVQSITMLLRSTIHSVTIPRIKSATIRNSIPFFHLWAFVLYHLNYPFTLVDARDIEFYTYAAKHDPLYVRAISEKTWYIGIPDQLMGGSLARSHLTPPVGTFDDTDTFPLQVLDRLQSGGLSSITNLLEDETRTRLWESIEEIISWVTHQHQISITSRISFHRGTVGAILFFLQHYDGISIEMLLRFCESTQSFWGNIFANFSDPSELNGEGYGSVQLLSLIQICGGRPEYLSLETRAMHALPVINGIRFMTSSPTLYFLSNLPEDGTEWVPNALQLIGRIPVHHLRSWMMFAFDEIPRQQSDILHEHLSFLSEIVYQLTLIDRDHNLFVESVDGVFTPSESASLDHLKILGISVALLVIHGDPLNAIGELFSDRKINDYYFISVSVHDGFCLVMNCGIFDQLFLKSELATLLEYIRNYNLIARTR